MTRRQRKPKERFFAAVSRLGTYGALPLLLVYAAEYFVLWLNPIDVMSPNTPRYQVYHAFSQSTGPREAWYDLSCWMTDGKKLIVLSFVTVWFASFGQLIDRSRRNVLMASRYGLPLVVHLAIGLALTVVLNPASTWFTANYSTSIVRFFAGDAYSWHPLFVLYRLWWPSFLFCCLVYLSIGIESLWWVRSKVHKQEMGVDNKQFTRLFEGGILYIVLLVLAVTLTDFLEKGFVNLTQVGGTMIQLSLLFALHFFLLGSLIRIPGGRYAPRAPASIDEVLKLGNTVPGVVAVLAALLLPGVASLIAYGQSLEGDRSTSKVERIEQANTLEEYTACLTTFLADRSQGGGRKVLDRALAVDSRLRASIARSHAPKNPGRASGPPYRPTLGDITRKYQELVQGRGEIVEQLGTCTIVREIWGKKDRL